MPTATTGLAADATEFRRAVGDAERRTGLGPEQIIHDYWLVRSLHGVAARHGATSEMFRERGRQQRVRVGRWAFGGGTSLTAAWGIGERYSEDIDGNLFVEHDGISKSVRHKVCKSVLIAALDALGPSEHITDGNNVRTTRVSLGDRRGFLKFETTIADVDSALVDRIVEPRRVMSIIGQHTDDASIDRFPELGGFAVLCVRPVWTAVNKFDALHRRAVAGDLGGIRARGRDLYDLWAISATAHADEARDAIPDLWPSAAAGVRAVQPRPAAGYGVSDVFVRGTPANDALRAGYEDAVADTVWGQAPPFAEALSAAQSLDMPS